ncbi:MAG: hypothetical protein H7A34_07170 [bacterium]|nr:hypothetical protein [bacterium]
MNKTRIDAFHKCVNAILTVTVGTIRTKYLVEYTAILDNVDLFRTVSQKIKLTHQKMLDSSFRIFWELLNERQKCIVQHEHWETP